MCVIIERLPGKTIPKEMLEIACDINKHGYGLAFANKGKMTTLRSLKDNDPEVIYKLLEKFKDKRVYLHLRHATVGAVNEVNNHPFYILNVKQDRMSMGFMHNGTLSTWRPKSGTNSDTFTMAKDFLEPLARRCLAFCGPEKVIHDDFFLDLVAGEIEGSSVFLLFDNFGNSKWLDHNVKKEYEWGTASNSYSFDKEHVRSSQRTKYPHYLNSAYNYDHYNHNHTPGTSIVPVKQSILPWEPTSSDIQWGSWEERFAYFEEETKELAAKAKDFDYSVVAKALKKEQVSIMVMLDKARENFVKKAGLKELSDVLQLSRENFQDLCREHPGVMADLFVDLAFELGLKKTKEENEAPRVAA